MAKGFVRHEEHPGQREALRGAHGTPTLGLLMPNSDPDLQPASRWGAPLPVRPPSLHHNSCLGPSLYLGDQASPPRPMAKAKHL